jgi:predicted enzyme related to lactoylglutathione lyase
MRRRPSGSSVQYGDTEGERVVITGVEKVVVPVEDQEQAKEFWTARVGFEVTQDQAYGDERWIEVSPPDGGPVLILSPRPAEQPRPQVPDQLPHSPVFFTCEDIQQTHRDLREGGVEFPAPPTQMDFGWWAMFTDQDGTRYALGQRN